MCAKTIVLLVTNISLGIATLISLNVAAKAQEVNIYSNDSVAQVQFAVGDISKALKAKGESSVLKDLNSIGSSDENVRIVIADSPDDDNRLVTDLGVSPLKSNTPQSYALRKVESGGHTTYVVLGADATGAMYGGLDLAEDIRTGTLSQLQDSDHSPHVIERGIKFNITFDARSPSYGGDSDSMQANIPEMWSMDFWKRFLDELARDRYNEVSLWNDHPFPSLERVPEYPNVALADVKRKEGGLWRSNLNGTLKYDPSWKLETVKTMTIDEKIAFWRQVMQYAKDRGIDVYIYIWNIYTYGTEGSGYGITDSPSNPITKDYFRKSIRTLFNTYPLLAGIGLTAGENMGTTSVPEEEQWLWDTYGLGIKDAEAAAKDPNSPYYNPHRVFRLVHRAWWTGLDAIVSQFNQLPGYSDKDSTLSFDFKYSLAQMYSSTRPLLIDNTSAATAVNGNRTRPGQSGRVSKGGFLDSTPPGTKTWLLVRNDAIFYMRWGDPDYARAYISNMPPMSKIAGYNVGPEGYTWGREFVSTEPDKPRQEIVDKMWYSFLLWGELGYDPTIPDSRFQAILGARFPEAPSSKLLSGWASVSKIIPLVTRFYFGENDLQWYPEACFSNITFSDGFQTVRDFMQPKWPPMNSNEDGDRPLLMSVRQFVGGGDFVGSGPPKGMQTPLETADLLDQYADAGLKDVSGISPGADKELRLTLGDIRAMAWLGHYYADKIRGAVSLYSAYLNGDNTAYQDARSHLQKASADWKEYATLWSKQYVGQVLDRLGLMPVDMKAFQAYVDADIPPPMKFTSTPATNKTQ